MDTPIDPDRFADAAMPAHPDDDSIADWTLDDFDDLASLRSKWTGRHELRD